MIEDKLHKNKLTYFAAKHTNSCQKCDETSKKSCQKCDKSVSISAIFFCFHLSGSKSRYLLSGVLGGSATALLMTSDIYSKKLTPCSLQEHASE